jgi:hypothetical protein
MTQHPDDHQPPDDGSAGRAEGNPKLDEDAAWRDIVAHWSETGSNPGDLPAETPDRPAEPVETPPVSPSLFDTRHLEPMHSQASWEEEGHFVPPPPPPLPTIEPRRKLAWLAMFGCPLVMLVSAVFGFSYPDWLSFLMVAGFVGGFVYLVATMARKRHDDWPGDDGAVV